MEVNKYILHCSKCDPSTWVEVYSEKVVITVDLKTDEYVFKTICPKCGKPIMNKRRAF